MTKKGGLLKRSFKPTIKNGAEFLIIRKNMLNNCHCL